MRTLFPTPARAFLAGVLTVFDVAPFLLLLPFQQTDLSTVSIITAILALGVTGAWLSVTLSPPKMRILWIVLATGAALNILTQLVTRMLPQSILDRLVPGVLSRLFDLDGEYAFDAAGYELWWEIWLFLALIGCAIAWAARRATHIKAQ